MPWAVLGPSSHLPTDSTLSPIPNKHPQMSTPDGWSDHRRPQVTRSCLLFHIRGFEVTHAAFRRQPLALYLPHDQQPATLDALKPTPRPAACHPGRSRSPIFLCVLFLLYPSLSKMLQNIFIYYAHSHLFLWSPECSPGCAEVCPKDGKCVLETHLEVRCLAVLGIRLY